MIYGKTFTRITRSLGLMAVFVGCVTTATIAQEQLASTKTGTEAVTVPLTEAVQAKNSVQRVFVGRLEPLRVVDLAFQVPGQILELPVSAGERLKKGDLIARLDVADFDLALARAQAAFDLTASEFKRSEELANRGAGSEARLDSAKAQQAQAEVALREAERRLAQTRIEAPFDALVGRIFTEAYANTTPAAPIVRLQDVSEMRVYISLPEEVAALARTRADDFNITATFPAAPGYQVELILREFVTEADPVAQTYMVEFAIAGQPDPRLLPGMTANVTAGLQVADDTGSVLVPVSAIDTTSAPEPRVWIFDDSTETVEPRTVRLGLPRESSILVLEGLTAGERVVSGGWWKLIDGMMVRPDAL
ncbi:efflux RND transporter periplasmic adaptor subunit [Litorivita pollutaquae]|uniref:Efflux RND transporter periplasmic adaptor subunit n=1 Tax=Litorivita pollutaquae TaxID=2200892 RepID=A0A2V4MRW8_9RHOB|nr:efflux RND transporter periplasmic adaptor subunit [Litorivita pollutaquae]PYC46898.1 efflux RND transporter periplasmic adaptor subunit [Litorivita pollutaquae]